MRTKSILFTALVVAASLEAFLSVALGAIPLSASMALEARTFLDDLPEVIDTDNDVWGPLLSPLSIAVSATTENPLNASSINVRSEGSATWPGPHNGSIEFNELGWTFTNATGTAAINTGIDWQYMFVASASGEFAMHGEVQGQGNTFGLWGWNVFVLGGPEGARFSDVQDANNPSATWDFSATLTAGETYTVWLRNSANLSASQPLSTEGSMDGQFAWRITPVPEPRTATLLILSSVILNLYARRRSNYWARTNPGTAIFREPGDREEKVAGTDSRWRWANRMVSRHRSPAASRRNWRGGRG